MPIKQERIQIGKTILLSCKELPVMPWHNRKKEKKYFSKNK